MRRGLIVVVLVLLAACSRPSPPTALEKNAAAKASAVDPESGQGRAEAAGRALLGQPGPAVTLKTIDGATVDLAKLYGTKPVYLKFWATWCAPCRQQMPGFEKDFESLGDKIVIVAVNAGFNDTPAAVEAYRRQLGIKMPIAIDDGTLAHALNLRVTPQHVVIGRDGRILYVGHLADQRLENALQAAIDEKTGPEPVSTANASGPAASPVEQIRTLDGSSERLADGRPHVLVFFTPWCETYFKTSRPAYAQNCRRVRTQQDALAGFGKAAWVDVASGIWASQKDLEDYRRQYAPHAALALDDNGAIFRAFGVRAAPTVIITDGGGHVLKRLAPDDPDLPDAIRASGA